MAKKVPPASEVLSPVRPKRVGRDETTSASPLRKLKAARQQRAAARVARDEVVLSTVGEYRAYVLENEPDMTPSPDVDVVVRAMFLWASEHTFGGRRLVRLHMTDAEPDEPLEELLEFEQAHTASDEDRIDVDALLLTVTLFRETLQSPKLPVAGAVIRIPHSRKRLVYEGRFVNWSPA